MTAATDLLDPSPAAPDPRGRAGRGRTRECRRTDRVLLLIAPAVPIVAVFFCYPFVYWLLISFSSDTGDPFARSREFLTDPYLRETIWYTLRLAVPDPLAGLLVVLPLAHRMRRDFRGKRLVLLVFLLPMTLGSVVIAEGMSTVFAPTGWFNLVLAGVGLGSVEVLYGNWGTFIAAMLGVVPLMLLLLVGFFGGVDPALENAAVTLGAGRARRFWRVVLPLVLPGVVVTFSLASSRPSRSSPSRCSSAHPTGRRT